MRCAVVSLPGLVLGTLYGADAPLGVVVFRRLDGGVHYGSDVPAAAVHSHHLGAN